MLTEKIILTSAHCFENNDNRTNAIMPFLRPMQFRVTSNSFKQDPIEYDVNQIVHLVTHVIPHPRYVRYSDLNSYLLQNLSMKLKIFLLPFQVPLNKTISDKCVIHRCNMF